MISRKNRKREPEKVFSETKLINGGRFQIIKCAEFGIERSTKSRKGLKRGEQNTNKDLEKPTKNKTSTKVEMAGKPTNENAGKRPESTKSDSLDVTVRIQCRNNVQVEPVEFLLVDEEKLSLSKLYEASGSHQKIEDKGSMKKRKRRSLEECLEVKTKSPKKLRKGGDLNNFCPKIENSAISSNEGVGGIVKEKLKMFGNVTNGTSLYGLFQAKKTSPSFERAKLQGGSDKHTSGPIVRGDSKKIKESPTVPQWLVELRMKKENRPMASMPPNAAKSGQF